jgi:hypothetical protein
MDDLSAEDGRFLLQISEDGSTAFNPSEDGVVARLLEAGLVGAERVDDETAILRLRAEA